MTLPGFGGGPCLRMPPKSVRIESAPPVGCRHHGEGAGRPHRERWDAQRSSGRRRLRPGGRCFQRWPSRSRPTALTTLNETFFARFRLKAPSIVQGQKLAFGASLARATRLEPADPSHWASGHWGVALGRPIPSPASPLPLPSRRARCRRPRSRWHGGGRPDTDVPP